MATRVAAKGVAAKKAAATAKVAPKQKELPSDIAAMTCGAQGCKLPPVHPWTEEAWTQENTVAHRAAYHAGTYRGSVSGFRALLSMVAAGQEVAYGKRDAKPKAAKPKSAGTSPAATKAATATTKRNRRLARANGGALRAVTPPVRKMDSGPVGRVEGSAVVAVSAARA